MSETHYRDKYRISSAQLAGYDYSANGTYFITTCTRQKECFFGEIVETQAPASLQATPIGQQAIDCWLAIPQHYPFVLLDEFQVMPNHIHGLLCIDRSDNYDWQPNTFGPQSRNLTAIIRGYKIGVTTFTSRLGINFGWQSRCHDQVFRNADELGRIRHYIAQNPVNWHRERVNEIAWFPSFRYCTQ